LTNFDEHSKRIYLVTDSCSADVFRALCTTLLTYLCQYVVELSIYTTDALCCVQLTETGAAGVRGEDAVKVVEPE